MIVKLYNNAQDVGWLGWVEVNGNAVAFIGLDGTVQWGWK